MKTCPSCQQPYPDDVESCPHDGARLTAVVRDERECPYCAELILRKARVCKHCHRDIEPLTEGDTSAQSQSSAPALGIPEARKSQPQATWPGTSARRPTAASKTPWLRAAPETPGKMRFILLGGAVLILVLAGAWYFLQRVRQPTQTAKRNAKGEQSLPTAGTVRQNPKDGMKYVWIPPGTFMMGCSAGDDCFDDEKPRHQVTITKGYWLGQTEVTAGAYKNFVGSSGGRMPPAPTYNRGWAQESMPVVGVSWDDAESYCHWTGGRLPTEAEWEYAARGGSTESRYGNPEDIAWHADNSGRRPHEVGLKQANGYGLYDMLGNLWEWVNDWYDPNYYQTSPSQDPTGPSSGEKRVLRGLSWYDSPQLFRVSIRTKAKGSGAEWVGSRGFRCAVAGFPDVGPSSSPAVGVNSPPLGFRGLHPGESRAEAEAAFRAQNWTMKCDAPQQDGSVHCGCNLAYCNVDFSPDDKLWFFSVMLMSDSSKSSQAVYQEIASILGSGVPEESVSGWIQQMDKRVGGQRFEWDTAGRVPCDFNSESECPPQRLTLYVAPSSAQVELWDYEYLAKSQGITKPDPNRPQPKVDKTFVLFGLKGGDSQEAVEATLGEKGYSPSSCKDDSGEIKCDTATGNYQFSLSFVHGGLESFSFTFPKSEWEEYVRLFKGTLGEPTDATKRTDAEVISWQSGQTTPCTPPNEEGKQCPVEFLMLSTGREQATAQALYTYAPLFNEMIIEQAQRMMGGRFEEPAESAPTAAQPTTAQGGVRPSFNCAFAKTPTEKQVCRDSDLAALERAMVNAYNQTLTHLPADQQATFRREHLAWFKEYARTCDAISLDGPRKDCIAGYLSNYTRQIEGYNR